MALLKFLKGNYASMSTAAIVEGQVLICGDTGEMFVDVTADKRVKIGDYVTVASLDALMAIDATAVPTSRLYYVEGANILARSNGATWDQINKDTGATSIDVVGEGNAVTAASYDAVTRKLTLTNGATFATKAELDNLDAFVGDIPDGYTETNVIAYINKKAEETLNAASGGSTESAASVKAALDTEVARAKAAEEANATAAANAQKAADDAQDAVDTLAETHATDKAALEGAIALKANAADVYDKDAIDGKVDTINGAIDLKANAADVYTKDDVDGMVNDLEAADLAINNLIGDVSEGKTVVEMIADAGDVAAGEVERLEGLIGDNADAIAQEVTNRGTAISDLKEELEGKIDVKADQTALDAEVQRATGVEGGFETRIKAIEDDYLKAADKTELQGNIDTLTGVVETLRDGVDAEKVDGVIDLINYVEEHGAEVTGMKEDIADNAQAIVDEAARASGAEEALGGRIDTLSGVVEGKAAQADLEGLDDRVEVAEGKITTLEGEMDAIEGRATTLEGKVANLETASATHATKDELQAVSDVAEAAVTVEEMKAAISAAGHASQTDLAAHIDDAVKHITADERAAWNAAEKNAKDHSDANLETAKAYADQAELDAIAAAKTETESQVAAEAAIARAAEQANATAISNEATAREQAVAGVQGDLDAYKTSNNTAVAGKADKATTLAGYGITDAMTADDIIAMFTWQEF